MDNLRDRVEALVRRYGDMIYRLAYQYTGNPADAEDIYSEVCLSMLTKDAPLFEEEHIRYWLVRVTVNKCHNLASSAARTRSRPLDEAMHLYAPEHESVLSEVMALPPKYRTVLYLHYYEGYTISEISEMMHTSPNTVGSWLRRGRRRLKLMLTEQEDQDETT